MSAMFAVQVLFPFLALAISQAVGPVVVFYLFGIVGVLAATMIAARTAKRNRA
jgi:hypothetical protein